MKLTVKKSLEILSTISKKINLRIVGSTVLKKHNLISRKVEDIDVVVTGRYPKIQTPFLRTLIIYESFFLSKLQR